MKPLRTFTVLITTKVIKIHHLNTHKSIIKAINTNSNTPVEIECYGYNKDKLEGIKEGDLVNITCKVESYKDSITYKLNNINKLDDKYKREER